MKKTICWIIVAAVLLICVLVYFKPLAFTDIVTEKHEIRMILSVFSIQNGEPDIDVVEYQDITAEQKNAVLAELEEYRYRRTPGTLFSDGTIEELGERMLTIHVLDERAAVDSIVVTSSGKIAVNDRVYRMKNAQEMIERMLEIVE